jgi:hypothetical protein
MSKAAFEMRNPAREEWFPSLPMMHELESSYSLMCHDLANDFYKHGSFTGYYRPDRRSAISHDGVLERNTYFGKIVAESA